MGPPYVTKDKVAIDKSMLRIDPDIYESNSQEQTMEVSFNDKILFSTPQVSRRGDQTQGSATLSARSVDSGFSDTTFNSTWTSSVNDTLSLSAQSFPDSEADSCRRFTLKAGDFSPINRRSISSLSGRKLKFGAFDPQPPPFLLTHPETCVNEYDECFEESSLCMDQDVSATEESASLYNCQNTLSSLHSFSTDNLKASLLEMAIDELPPSLSTISRKTAVQFCECCQHNYNTAEKNTALLPRGYSPERDIKPTGCSKDILPHTQTQHSSEHEKGSYYLFSPTKDIKTEFNYMSLPDDERAVVIYGSNENASRTILNGENCSNLNSETLRPDYDLSQLWDPSPRLPAWTSTEATSREEFEKSYSICSENLTKNIDLTPHINSRYIGDILDTEITPRNSLNILDTEVTPRNFLNILDIGADNLQKVIKKFSPSEPTRLIGRNVGVRKMDIIQELYSKNIRPGLERIFEYLTSADLISIASVSTLWKLAMYSDKKAYNRYRQHKRSHSKSNVQHGPGKENWGEKPVDAPSEPSLTEPRGLLSSMQSQATRKIVEELPPVTPIQETLMSDDVLRICPRCQGPAMIKHRQDRATCMSEKCSYDFCTLCFSSFHHPRQCKPLCKASSKGDVAGTRKSKKNLKRL